MNVRLQRFFLIIIFALSFGFLAACDTAAERAEKHYQSALSLLEEGDLDRAVVELRNVFKLDGQHRDARKTFAKIQRDRGNIREAIGQYLRLVEQYPDDLDGQRALAELQLSVSNWPESERHVDAALALEPNDLPSQAIRRVIDYGQALEAKDEAAIAAAVKAVSELREKLPDNLPLRQVIIDNYVKKSDFSAALEELDAAIELEPGNKELVGVRISILAALDDDEAVEKQLIDFMTQFPDDEAGRVTLIRWYLSRGQIDDAEAFLRSSVHADDEDNSSRLDLVRFLSEYKGVEAAIAELDKIIASDRDAPVFRALRAGLTFDQGNRDAGISDLQAMLAEMEPSDESRNIKIALSRMLIATGNSVGARSLVEEVLAEDAGHVEALKLKADWLIDDDQVGEAIISLRAALDQAPDDAEVMSLMARAYDREGNQELVGEMLSLAFDASNKAPDEAIRYAQFLSNREKFVTAETILIDALRLAPDNVLILGALGNLYLAMEDWGRAEQVAATLERAATEDAVATSRSLTTRLLQLQNKTGEAIAYLEGLVAKGDVGLAANIEIIRSMLSTGDIAGAKLKIDGLLAQNPEDVQTKSIKAAVDAATGDLDSAEAIYRELLSSDDSNSETSIALFRLLDSQGRKDEARETIEQALSKSPDNLTLQWIHAGILEKSGDVDGAIGIYEAMYAKDSSNQIIANNLASLLADHRTDEASLEKAYTIAKRLRGSDIAPFQDTYGWIAYLRGQNDEALEALEPAAKALSDDPMAQYHLAKLYLKLERKEDALAQFLKVSEMTSEADTRPFVQTAREEVRRLMSEKDAEKSE